MKNMELIKSFGLDSLSSLVSAAYDLGDGETLLCFDYDRVREFCCALVGLGWRAAKHFSLGNTDGTFYEHESGRTMYVYTNSGVPFARAVLGARLAADDAFVGEQIYNDTVFYQVYNNPKTGGGMTYLVRTKDGRFIVIDGGFSLDGEGLLRVMSELHPLADESQPYDVAAWIVTHPHNDHIELLKRITDDDAVMSRLNIKRMYASLPTAETLRGVDNDVIPDNEWMRGCLERLRAHGCKIVKPYAGMRYKIGELTMNIYYTQAEWRFIDMKTVNDASIVFSLTRDGGKTVLIPGDIMDRAAKYIMTMYTDEQLHADVVQVAHHALIGPDIKFYEAIKPKICLWPIGLRGYGYTQYPSITERNDKLHRMDVINCVACFGPTQIVI